MSVPVLVTVDVELAPDHDEEQQARALADLGRHIDGCGLRGTYFVTADAAERHPGTLLDLQQRGAQIGCHGLHHGPDEDYRRLPPATTDRLIEEATGRVASVTGRPPTAFRAPRMAASAAAHSALVDAGYAADFSVCPQRLDFGNSPGAALGGLRAPRVPYRPSRTNPFRRGDRPLWVVPLSGLGLPLLSGLLYASPPALVRAMAGVLVREAAATGGALVFLCHSYELAERLPGRRPRTVQRRYVRSSAERRARLFEFLRHLGDLPALEPMTADQLVEGLGGSGAG